MFVAGPQPQSLHRGPHLAALHMSMSGQQGCNNIYYNYSRATTTTTLTPTGNPKYWVSNILKSRVHERAQQTISASTSCLVLCNTSACNGNVKACKTWQGIVKHWRQFKASKWDKFVFLRLRCRGVLILAEPRPCSSSGLQIISRDRKCSLRPCSHWAEKVQISLYGEFKQACLYSLNADDEWSDSMNRRIVTSTVPHHSILRHIDKKGKKASCGWGAETCWTTLHLHQAYRSNLHPPN